MKIKQTFTYTGGPYYSFLEAMHQSGYTQKIMIEMMQNSLGYKRRRLFALKDISKTPHSDDEYIRILTESFNTMAQDLSEQYHTAGKNNKKIKTISVVNNQGLPRKGVADILRELFGIEDIPVYHLTGINCAGSFMALQNLYYLRKSNPLKDDECDLILSIEVPSVTMRYKRSFKPMGYFLYDNLVSDGGGLMVIESNDSGPGIEILSSRNRLYPNTQNVITSRFAGNQLEQTLSPEFTETVLQLSKTWPATFSADYGVDVDQVKHWIVHPGSIHLLKNFSEGMEIDKEHLENSVTSVLDAGNTMSSMIIYIIQRFMNSGKLNADDTAMLVGFAPGSEIIMIKARYI